VFFSVFFAAQFKMDLDKESGCVLTLSQLQQSARNICCFMVTYIVLDVLVVHHHIKEAWHQNSMPDRVICFMFMTDICLALIILVSFRVRQVSVDDDWWENRRSLITINLFSNTVSLALLTLARLMESHKSNPELAFTVGVIFVFARTMKLIPLAKLHKAVVHVCDHPDDDDRYDDLIAGWAVKDFTCEKILIKMFLCSIAIVVILLCLAAAIDAVVSSANILTTSPTPFPMMPQQMSIDHSLTGSVTPTQFPREMQQIDLSITGSSTPIPTMPKPIQSLAVSPLFRKLSGSDDLWRDTKRGAAAGGGAGAAAGVGLGAAEVIGMDAAAGATVGGPVGAAVGAIGGFVMGIGALADSVKH